MTKRKNYNGGDINEKFGIGCLAVMMGAIVLIMLSFAFF